MSHGAGEEKHPPPPVSSDSFARAIARVAVAQILSDGLGIGNVQRSVLDALSDVSIKYILSLGKSAKSYSNLSGRSDSNAFDVIRSLEDFAGPGCLPAGAAEPDLCPVGSRVIRDIRDYALLTEEIQFAQPIPRFPIARLLGATVQRRPAPPRGDHIPAWLPAFPDSHTYMYSRESGEGEVVEREVDRLERARQRRKAEKSLLRLQKRLALAGSVLPDTDVGDRNRGASEAVDSLEPVIEAVRAAGNGGVGIENGHMDGLARRSPMRFRLGFDRRTLTPAVPLVPGGPGGADLWVTRDEERNEKKRRAEAILRESMENPHDLVRL